MAAKDFDLDQMAAYLHLTPEKVSRMADRGRIPGRRVNGEWRFPEADVHLWLEEQIGASDLEQLDEMQGLLDRWAPDEIDSDKLRDVLHPEAIVVPMLSKTRGSIIRDMCQMVADTGMLWDPEKMAEAVQAREALHPTALENGVALLHPRRPQTSILSQSIVGLGIATRPVPFGNQMGYLTDIFFLICSYDDRIHLRILSQISRLIANPDLLAQLRSAESPGEARQAILDAEQALVP